MTIAMILIRHAKDQNIHLLHQDRVIIVASIIVVHRHRMDIIRNHLADGVQAVAVIVVATPDIQIDIQINRVNIQNVNGHRVDQAKAVTNVISIRMKEVIHEVIATNKVVIELVVFCTCQSNEDVPNLPQKKKNFRIKYKSNVNQ